MDFVTVVDQVMALLRQRGRVAYRTLKVQFHLADAPLPAYGCGLGAKYSLGTCLAHTSVRSGRFSDPPRSRAYRLL